MPLEVPSPYVPRPRYGRLLLESLPAELRARPIVITQPEPWQQIRRLFDADATQLHFAVGMEHADVLARSDAFGPASVVIGVGGGTALDHAKYTAWRRGLPLVLAPSILSVDAAFTRAIGVREGARVRYVGDARPDHLLVDFGLLQAAPPLLNRAGAADVLSIFTALHDWEAAAERTGEGFAPDIAAEARALLERLLAGAAGLRDQTEEGLRLLAELYVGEVVLCERWGNARPEEGSEHYVAYALEARSGGHYVHGQLVGLGVVLAGLHQGQDVAPVARFLRELDLDCRYEAVGTSRAEMRAVLLGMGEYVRQEAQLLPGVFHLRGGVPAGEVDALLDAAEAALAR